MGLLEIIKRLLWEEPAPEKLNPYPADDYRHDIWEAVQQWSARKQKGSPRVASNFRPLELDEEVSLATALRGLPDAKHLAPEPAKSEGEVRLQAGKGDMQEQLRKAAQDQHERNVKLGVKERTHYYGAAELGASGEVDRRYQVKKKEDLPELTPDTVPNHEQEKEETVWEVE